MRNRENVPSRNTYFSHKNNGKNLLENNLPLLVSTVLTPVRTTPEVESLESVDVFVLTVFVTSILVVTLRDAPVKQRTTHVDDGNSAL